MATYYGFVEPSTEIELHPSEAVCAVGHVHNKHIECPECSNATPRIVYTYND